MMMLVRTHLWAHWCRLLLTLSSILPGAPPELMSTMFSLRPTPQVFRALHPSRDGFVSLLLRAIATQRWEFVAYCVQADLVEWIEEISAHDNLEPFAMIVKHLDDEPRPLPVYLRPGASLKKK